MIISAGFKLLQLCVILVQFSNALTLQRIILYACSTNETLAVYTETEITFLLQVKKTINFFSYFIP